MSITGKRPYTGETSSKALAAVMPRTADYLDKMPPEPPQVQDTGHFTKTRISVQFTDGPREEMPTSYAGLLAVLAEMREDEVKVQIVRTETRVRRVEFGRKYL